MVDRKEQIAPFSMINDEMHHHAAGMMTHFDVVR
jgi:hypothetical protein